MDTLGQMATFVRVVEVGSLSAAARQLRVSVAAVSRQLTDLEARVGAVLLLRSTRRLGVTDAGRRYYARCVAILREVDDAQADARGDGATARGQLTVSAPVTFGLARVWPHLPALLASHPALQIDLRLEDRMIDLVSDAVDVAIRVGAAPPDTTTLVAQPLATYARAVVAAPAYLARRGAPRDPEALARHDALVHLPAGGAPAVWRFVRDGRETAAVPRGALRTNALAALREGALAGLGLALLPAWLVGEDLARGALRAVLTEWTVAPVTAIALYRAELRGAARVRALLEHLRAAWKRATA